MLQPTFADDERTPAQPDARRLWRGTLIWGATFCCLVAGAALFPKLIRQVPVELRGDYVLLLKMNPDHTHQQFTNRPFFATFLSNRVVLAHSGRSTP